VNLITIVFLLPIADVYCAQQIIPWDNADAYYGQFVIVEGTIAVTYYSGEACFLNFHSTGDRYFTAVIFRSDFHKFPHQPEQYYNGKKVHVTGFVKQSGGKPAIILNDPSQIKILQ
jgi:DNA/RNA endonuclease YhcR with UshA esterase domain